MKLKSISDSVGITPEDLSKCFIEFWESLQDSLSHVDLDSAIKSRSTSMKTEIRKATSGIERLNWIPRTRDGQAVFQLDAKYICDFSCGESHIANIVICLNNREAIGTNFLKLEIASTREIRTSSVEGFSDNNVLGVLITFDQELLSLGGWDQSYAFSSEYASAYKMNYRQVLKSNIMMMRLHAV